MMDSDTQASYKADDVEMGNESHVTDNKHTVPTRSGSDNSLQDNLNSNQSNRNEIETVEKNNASELIQLQKECKAMIRYINQLKKEESQYYHQNEILAREAILNGYQPHIVQAIAKASTGSVQVMSNNGTGSKKRSRTSSTSLGNVGSKKGKTGESKKNMKNPSSSPVKVQSTG